MKKQCIPDIEPHIISDISYQFLLLYHIRQLQWSGLFSQSSLFKNTVLWSALKLGQLNMEMGLSEIFVDTHNHH